MSASPREGSANAGSANGLEEKPRLSEHEKKANHIASGKGSQLDTLRAALRTLSVTNCAYRAETQTSNP